MKTRTIIIALMALVSHVGRAQDSIHYYEMLLKEKPIRNHDFLMPGKGKSMLEFYSGIPFIGIGQFSYGFSDRFSVGIIYGYTPDVLGYGLRIKAVIAQPSESVRINLKAPLIYYPKMSREVAEPWVAVWPTLNIEKKLKNETKFWFGVGVLGAACVEYFIPEKVNPYPESEIWDEPKAEILNTIQFGFSQPLSDKWSFMVEVAPVMKGFKFITPHGLINNLPAFVTMGVSYTL